MAALAKAMKIYTQDNSTAATAVVEQSGSVTTTVVPATGADVGVNNVEEAEGQGQEKARVYTCRICRRVVFAEADLENHQTAQQGFCRRKSKGVTSAGVCSSYFLAEPPLWMEEQQTGEVEGKISCPNKACGARLGSLKWTGAQCSCGSWVTPAIQFAKKNLDSRSAAPAGPPPGTVLHSSLVSTRLVQENTTRAQDPE